MTNAELEELAERVAARVAALLGGGSIGARRAKRLEREAGRASDDVALERMGLRKRGARE